MTDNIFKRQHLRAPLKMSALYQMDDFAFKAYTLNISEGGVLLDNLPKVPEIKAIPLILCLIEFPILSEVSTEVVLGLGNVSFEKKVIRAKARIVRSFEGFSEVDKIFVTKIGCEFVKMDERARKEINDYVSRYAKNLIYFLNLFEGKTNKDQHKNLLRKVASLLGYDDSLQLAQLRLRALHDYQSLEST